MQAFVFLTNIIMVGFCNLALTALGRDCWTQFGHSQYILKTEYGGVKFEGVKNICEKINSTFLSIETKEENDFVHSMVVSIVNIPVWIGLKRIGHNKYWMDGSDVTYFGDRYQSITDIGKRVGHDKYWMDGSDVTYFGDRYQSITDIEACVYMLDGWIEAKCHSELYFFCKRNASSEDNCSNEGDSTTQRTRPTTDIDVSKTKIFKSDTQDMWTFEEMIDDLRIKRKPKYKAVEAPGGKAIGSIAVVILIVIFAGVVFLDLSTIQNHLKLFIRNIGDAFNTRM